MRYSRTVLVWIGVAFLMAASAGYFLFMRLGDLTGPEARRLVERGAQLLDVRTPEEFAAGHIPGAINVPVQELETRLGELAPKERTVVVYCRSGNRSSRAARILKGAGHTTVHNLGAMSRW